MKRSFAFVSNRAGMTLIEIMIVLAILGSLAALLLPRFTGAADKAKVKEAKIQMGQLIQALQMYKTDCNRYPESLSGLTQKDSCNNWGPEAYVKKEKDLKDPWGNDFLYERKNSDFELRSLGQDGQEGGDGYALDISSEEL